MLFSLQHDGNDPELIPDQHIEREGVRTITYSAHTSLLHSERSKKFVTLYVTTAVGTCDVLMQCHKLAAFMSCFSEISPRPSLGGQGQVEENGLWIDHDSRDSLVVLDTNCCA